jgi:hypothetical protein
MCRRRRNGRDERRTDPDRAGGEDPRATKRAGLPRTMRFVGRVRQLIMPSVYWHGRGTACHIWAAGLSVAQALCESRAGHIKPRTSVFTQRPALSEGIDDSLSDTHTQAAGLPLRPGATQQSDAALTEFHLGSQFRAPVDIHVGGGTRE